MPSLPNINEWVSSLDNRQFARFGHTITQLSFGRMLVFGGAIENNENSFVTTNDTYLLTMEGLVWTKLES